MINLKDVTFTIPIRIDTEERKRNLRTTVHYLNAHFDTNIMICEESSQSLVPDILKDLPVKYAYSHIKTDNPLMHRTRLLNIMARNATTPYIANYDADVLLKDAQYVTSLNLLREDKADMVYPYNGRFMDILGATLDKVINHLSVEHLVEKDGNLLHPNSLGGAVIWNKQKFIENGLENENFVSWGWEDNERLTRAQKLGYRVARVDGCLFHMHHPPSQNSANASHPQYFKNEQEFYKVYNMSPQNLRNYINTWEWAK
jgi:predicted glycosyltransferase involved in capsule biosynthesis